MGATGIVAGAEFDCADVVASELLEDVVERDLGQQRCEYADFHGCLLIYVGCESSTEYHAELVGKGDAPTHITVYTSFVYTIIICETSHSAPMRS
jgi:hypothetical protein